MSKITLDLDEVTAKEIEKRETKIAKLQVKVKLLERRIADYEKSWAGIKSLRDEIERVAYLVEPYWNDDGP